MLGESARVYKQITTCLLVISSVVLCMSCYEYARALSDDDLNRVSLINVLQSNQSKQQLKLNAEIEVQDQILQFMVWPNERHKTQEVLESLLQQKMNTNPYDHTGILSLLSLQAEINRPTDEKLWTLQRGIALNQWQKSLRPLLARHCILYSSSIQPPLSQNCDSVIARLPWQTQVGHLAKLLGVDQPTLEQALARVRAAK